ncbi:MAG TPA: amino acid adenylation domain-containing protein, partial [Polyangiaceae bacterium]|nr:amino acid adenylation domain-containing protein [Polyangiaceae bacterium]
FGPTAKDMMGLFTNSLPVRAFVVGHCTVEQLLHSLREQSLKARRFETTPLSEIFRASDVPAGMPVFETLVMYENRSLGDTLKELGGEKWADRQVHLHERPSFPLTLIVYDGSEFTMRMLYDRRRLSEKAVQRLLASCKQALTEFALNSNRTLAEIDVLPVLERRKILVEWNHTAAPFSDELCIHQLFEASVDIEPTAPAVEVNGRVLSYRELEERANQVAHLLISRGVEPGTYVGICLRRGFDLIIAMLGILKAGAAYLPLDPEYPADRLQFMLKDVSAALVITQEGIAPGLDYARVVVDGADTQAIAQCPVDRPPLGVDSASKCYTIFTSGSTGQPKGVVLTHRAVINTLEWVNRTFDVAPSDRLLFVTSPCFDLSVYDIFGVLGRGGTVVVATEELLSQPEALAEFIVDAKITIWDSAPAALQRLVPFIAKKGGFDLRLCMLSGDWIPLPLPDAVRAVFPYCRVISLGGATEAAIWSNWFPIEQLDERWTSIPYGRPIQNSRYFVLHSRLQPVPVGVSGDLYISGVCLASGYHARPELTAERFITVPFPEASGQICYKTGDLARYFEDGNLEFLGRSDFQVKIRGFRVEMGEVEAVLSQFEGVEVAVCVALPDASGQKSLIAYVVPKKGQVLDEEVIKVSVGAKLPVFMVPSRIVFLDALPTTRNGKLDRAALPDPHLRVVDDKLVPPQGAVEEELVRMWSDLLQRDQISVTDHFFEVGGHSLLAVMLVARIKDRFHHDLPLATLLGSPTIRKLAPHIERATGVQAASKHLQVFHQDGVLPPLVLVPGVVGTAFTYRSLPDALGPYQPIYVVDLLAAGGVSEFPDTIEGMADLYEPE